MRRIRIVIVNKKAKVFQTEFTVYKGRKRFVSVELVWILGSREMGGILAKYA